MSTVWKGSADKRRFRIIPLGQSYPMHLPERQENRLKKNGATSLCRNCLHYFENNFKQF